MRQRFIYLLGPEGAGKTSLARLLSYYIRNTWNNKVKIVEIRSSHLHAYYFRNFLIRLGRVEYYRYPKGILIPRIDRTYVSRNIMFILLMEFTAVIMKILFTVYLPLMITNYAIICTRYIIDTLVDLLALTLMAPRGRLLIYKFITPILLRLIPTNSLIIHLYADYDILVRRYEKRGSYIEPRKWINFYCRISRTLLKIISDRYRVVSVGTSRKKLIQVFRDVLNTLAEK